LCLGGGGGIGPPTRICHKQYYELRSSAQNDLERYFVDKYGTVNYP
jgi:hypothetical protein